MRLIIGFQLFCYLIFVFRWLRKSDCSFSLLSSFFVVEDAVFFLKFLFFFAEELRNGFFSFPSENTFKKRSIQLWFVIFKNLFYLPKFFVQVSVEHVEQKFLQITGNLFLNLIIGFLSIVNIVNKLLTIERMK